MMRALFAGVTALKSHQTRMDVIGNNISNVNTLGFKKSDTTFADLYSETLSPSSAPSQSLGGINPKQVGLGATVASIVIKHAPGAAQYTGNPLDLAIAGDGFFVVRTPDGNKFTRAGNFTLSSSGALVSSSGYYVQTYDATWKTGTEGVARSSAMPEKSKLYFDDFKFVQDNQLTSGTTSGSYGFKVVSPKDDPKGVGYVSFKRNDMEIQQIPLSEFKVKTQGTSDSNPAIPSPILGAELPSTAGSQLVKDTVYSVKVGSPNVAGYVGEITFKVKGDTEKAAATTGFEYFNDVGTVVNNMLVEVTNNDGYVPGNILGDLIADKEKFFNVSINESGGVIGQLTKDVPADPVRGLPPMSKGEKVVLGYVAVAGFANNEGLEKVATNLYTSSANSGNPDILLPGSSGVGSLTPSSLEMSNVDLSEEMVNMIVTQRGFQANSRTITTTDSMLEELINLKR